MNVVMRARARNNNNALRVLSMRLLKSIRGSPTASVHTQQRASKSTTTQHCLAAAILIHTLEFKMGLGTGKMTKKVNKKITHLRLRWT